MTGIISPWPRRTRPADQALVRGQLAGAAASGSLALAWLALSWWHPKLSYHFGPPLAAAAWPVLLRARLRTPARLAAALTAVSAGLLVAMAAHWLRGPALIGAAGSVPAEEVVLSVVAGAWGWRVAARQKRAWFLPTAPSLGGGPPASPAERGQ
jgi:hypothetical protein